MILSLVTDPFRSSVGAAMGYDPNDERIWSSSYGSTYMSGAGVPVSHETALQVSCVFLGARLYSEIIGSTPIKVYRRRDDGGKTEARDHELWELLRTRPNAWQTGQQFRELLTGHATLWPFGLAEILSDKRGGILELVPVQPETVECVEQMADRTLRYKVRQPDGTHRYILQADVFRIDSFGFHKLMGTNLVRQARETFGLWLALEKYSAHYFSQGGGGQRMAVSFPQGIQPDALTRAQEIISSQMGVGNAHKVLFGPAGATWKEWGFNARDSQMSEAREMQIGEVARWMNLPPHLLGSSKQPTYASVEMFNREFHDFRLLPVVRRIEASIARDLVTEPDVVVEHLLDGFLRGNSLERWQVHEISLRRGVKTRNEVRIQENLNPIDGLDEPEVDQNLAGKPDDAPQSAPPPRPSDDEPEQAARTLREVARAEPPRRLVQIVRGTAARLVRKECLAIAKGATKHAADRDGWRDFVATFYAEHGQLVAEDLDLPPSLVRGYVERHRDTLLADGAAVLEAWKTEAVEQLTEYAVKEACYVA
jgi:HK97 family phage portal protein